jgi:hypothetical protein
MLLGKEDGLVWVDIASFFIAVEVVVIFKHEVVDVEIKEQFWNMRPSNNVLKLHWSFTKVTEVIC